MKLIPRWLSSTVLTTLLSLAMTPGARAQSITSYDWNETVTLKLRDGRHIEGHYRGVLGGPESDTPYADRYETWRDELGPAMSPALGETLAVVLKSGDTMSGTFHGFTDKSLLLGTADSCVMLVLPLKKVSAVRRGNEPHADPAWTAARGQWKSAPSLCVIALKDDDITMAVPTSMFVRLAPRTDPGSGVVGGVVLGLLVGTVIAGIAVTAAWASAFSHALI